MVLYAPSQVVGGKGEEESVNDMVEMGWSDHNQDRDPWEQTASKSGTLQTLLKVKLIPVQLPCPGHPSPYPQLLCLMATWNNDMNWTL